MIAMYVLGAVILLFLGIVYSMAYILYCIFSTLWFMRFVCTYCPNFGHPCPSGYSKIAARLFKKRQAKEFRAKFRVHVGIVFPSWFAPVIVALFILLKEINTTLIILFVAFIIFGFVLLPLFSRRYGCKSCRLRNNCPWMKDRGK